MLRPLLLAVTLLTASCAYIPRHLDGVPAGEPWTALPLKRWLAEDRIAPGGIAGCWSPDCPERLAVGVFSARGREAEVLERVLADPEGLARALRTPPRPRVGPTKGAKPKTPVRVEVQVSALREGPARGFLVTLARADEARAPVHGAALGLRGPDGLGVVIVVGSDEAAVAGAARRAARGNLPGL